MNARSKRSSSKKPAQGAANWWVQLDSSGDADTVLVIPEDQDKFMLPMKAAIDGCKLVLEQDRFQEQFKRLLERLARWTQTHGEDVARVRVGCRDSRLLFLVERRTACFNRALEDELTSLDIEIANDKQLDLIKLQVLALPRPAPEIVESLLAPGLLMTYENAERRVAHKAGK